VNSTLPPGLVEPAELMQAALGGTRTCVWEWHIDSDLLSDIQLGSDILGWPPGSVGNTQADWNALIHPDDLEGNDAAYQRHARGETDTYEHSYRARSPDGSWLWLQERGRIVERGPQGQPLRMVGTQIDITERRQLEAQASDAALRLERLANHVPGVLFQLEPFQRGAQAQGSVEGTGIGLSVTRALVTLMAGRVQVFSQPGVGSRFSVTLPPAEGLAMPGAQSPASST
jgi:PAS domain S-box-containing protein